MIKRCGNTTDLRGYNRIQVAISRIEVKGLVIFRNNNRYNRLSLEMQVVELLDEAFTPETSNGVSLVQACWRYRANFDRTLDQIIR